jgi:flagellar biosynthesis anti-sigma factor FlgM
MPDSLNVRFRLRQPRRNPDVKVSAAVVDNYFQMLDKPRRITSMTIHTINNSSIAPVRKINRHEQMAPFEVEKQRNQQNSMTAGTDELQLTQESSHLRTLEANLGKEPVTDQERIEALRKAIGNGGYQVNAVRVAEKLLSFETDLFK